MNIILKQDDYLEHYVFFNESVKNTVMDDSSFIRIIYSNKNFTLNGIYFKLPFITEISRTEFYKNETNNLLLVFIEKLEKSILTLYNVNKLFSYKLNDHILNIINKLYSELNKNYNNNKLNIILKISGIWETCSKIGLTFKLIDSNRL